MVQRGEHPRFALEAREPIRVARDRARQDLDRDVAPELRVARAVHLAHAARAEQRLQVIPAEGAAGHGAAGASSMTRSAPLATRAARRGSRRRTPARSAAIRRRAAATRHRDRPRRETPRARPAAGCAPRDTAPRSASSVQASCEAESPHLALEPRPCGRRGPHRHFLVALAPFKVSPPILASQTGDSVLRLLGRGR